MPDLQQLVRESKRIVFFGGAGVSTESGIPDFRSADGIYHQKYPYPPEVMVSHTFFVNHPEEFFAFYREKMVHLEAKPNAAHYKLAQLEAAGKLSAVVTQNIDGLHQAAGSRRVLELHGSVHRNHCMRCGRSYDVQAVVEAPGVPRCSCGGIIKPDVVLYEESLDSDLLTQAVQEIAAADLVIVGGTSLAVYPAAGLLDYRRGKLVIINRSPTPVDAQADLLIQAPIGTTLGALTVE